LNNYIDESIGIRFYDLISEKTRIRLSKWAKADKIKIGKLAVQNYIVMAQVLDKELNKYWEQLDNSQKKSILTMIKSFLHPSEKHPRITIEQYNKEIDAAMARMDKGEVISNEDALKEIDKW
jgi:predicted transcriptional regulator